MDEQMIEIEAESLEEARELLKSRIPEGLDLLSEQIISDGKPKTVNAVADTTAAAFAKAQSEIPPNAEVVEKKELSAPGLKVITVEAFDEEQADLNAKIYGNRRFGTSIVKSLKLVTKGRKGFLGIGKQPNQYEAELFKQAVVQFVYKAKAKISAKIGKKETLVLAVMAYQASHGSLKWVGEDANKNSFNLYDVGQPAIIFVPKETLPHLQKDRTLWSRVKNPEVYAEISEKKKERQGTDSLRNEVDSLMESLLLGAITITKLETLLPGEFQVNVVETSFHAKIAVAGYGTVKKS